MKRFGIVSAIAGCIVVFSIAAFAQQTYSPVAPAPLAKAAAFRLSEYVLFYNQSASYLTHSEQVPTAVWGVLFTPPPTPVKVCTVWTVDLRYHWIPGTLGVKDTLHITLREASGSYNVFYSGFFIPKHGDNFGEIELDPPIFPNIQRSVLNPVRAFYLTYQVKGQSGGTVVWNMRTPSGFTSPVRSVQFVTPTNIVSASSVVGTSVDHETAIRVYPMFIPVELSLFSARFTGSAGELLWKTEKETNNYGFEVRRGLSPEGPWESRGFVPGKGTSATAQWYEYSDPFETQDAVFAQEMWYRLVQYDYDGTAKELMPVRVQLAVNESPGYALYGSYPNPISTGNSSSATFRLQLPEAQEVTLSVYDALGRLVATPFRGSLDAGYREIAWNLRDMPDGGKPGTYFLQMSAGSYRAARAFVIAR